MIMTGYSSILLDTYCLSIKITSLPFNTFPSKCSFVLANLSHHYFGKQSLNIKSTSNEWLSCLSIRSVVGLIEGLQLNNLINENTIHTVLVPCVKHTHTHTQTLFKFLDSSIWDLLWMSICLDSKKACTKAKQIED